MRHPVVGELYLHRYRLSIPRSGGQHVIIFRAIPTAQRHKRWRNSAVSNGGSLAGAAQPTIDSGYPHCR